MFGNSFRPAALAAALGAAMLVAAPALAQDQIPTREEIVRGLTPSTPAQTRAISIGVGADSGSDTGSQQPPAGEPAQAPSMSFPQVQFEFNSDQLTPTARQVLAEIGLALRDERLAPYRFAIKGHTDAVGSDQYNLALSQRRAASVRNYLVSTFNIDPGRLESQGLGESQLFDAANPNAAANRRVEITNLGTGR